MVYSIQMCDNVEQKIESGDTLETPEAVCGNYKEMHKQQLPITRCIAFPCSVAFGSASLRLAFVLNLFILQ